VALHCNPFVVAGHDLGSGAFSTVKFAKQIVRGSKNDEWPRFAVKIMPLEKIVELGCAGVHSLRSLAWSIECLAGSCDKLPRWPWPWSCA